jgi:hypothetical protein
LLSTLLNQPRRSKRTQKQKEKPHPYADTDTLLKFIENGKQAEFRETPKFINNEDRLKLAKAVIARYDPEETDEGPGHKESNQEDQETALPTPPCSPSHQTQEQWLELLLEALAPDPRARRNLAEELIKKMGQDEMRQGPLEKEGYDQQVSHFRILKYVMENTDRLCYDKDDMNQTLFHIAGINGAQMAIMICLSVIDTCRCGSTVHAPGCRTVTHLLTEVDKEGYSPVGYAIIKSKTQAVSRMLNLLGNTGEEEIRKLLRKAITSSSGNNVDIIRELLTVRPAGTEKEYRTDVLKQDILQLAAKHFNSEVFEFLRSVGSAVLNSPHCSLIHYVVYIGQVEAAKYLLKQLPGLATKLHVHPDHAYEPGSNTTVGEQKLAIIAQGPASSAEVDEEKFPVLALYNGGDTELRDLIFETLMERLSISELREHLVGQTCKSSCQLCMWKYRTTTNRLRNRDGQRDLTRCHHPCL